MDKIAVIKLRATVLLERAEIPGPAKAKLTRIANAPRLADAEYLKKFDALLRREEEEVSDAGFRNIQL
jgi:hypothetical protein